MLRGRKLIRLLCDTIKTIRLAWFVQTNNLFSSDRFDNLFKLIQQYLELQKGNVKNTVKSGRDVHRSFNLLKNLICVYEATENIVTLNQILEVLKVEFVKREDKDV